jgi:hypothetical protein
MTKQLSIIFIAEQADVSWTVPLLTHVIFENEKGLAYFRD